MEERFTLRHANLITGTFVLAIVAALVVAVVLTGHSQHAVDVLPDLAVNPWRAACGQLGLTAVGIEERVVALDHFLDDVESLLDDLSAQHGLETSPSI